MAAQRAITGGEKRTGTNACATGGSGYAFRIWRDVRRMLKDRL
jgi:hypothetical protein